ncbi:uncharacterized protein J3R85_016186 [Psidium guajava]|nr:uncharacterized protein J3R85_016186 [Psidium guajava]
MRNAFVLACILFISVTPLFLPSTEAGRLLLQSGGYSQPGAPGWPGPGVRGRSGTPYRGGPNPAYQQPPCVRTRTCRPKVDGAAVP